MQKSELILALLHNFIMSCEKGEKSMTATRH